MKAATLACAAAALLVLLAGGASADPFTVEKDPGNFTIDSVNMTSSSGHWNPGSIGTITVTGKTLKDINAGTVKYQLYETGVRSFIGSGSSSFFTCDNKGCDLTKPIALTLSDTTGKAGSGYTLTFSFMFPDRDPTSTSNDFKVVFWCEDQDHFPYDMSVSISYTAVSPAPTFGADGIFSDPITVDKQPGNFTVSTVSMHSSPFNHWYANHRARVIVTGKTLKDIVAGTVQYQIYETGVRSFIASGSSPYFTCDNKGCDPAKPIALNFADKKGAAGSAYTLAFDFFFPTTESSSKDFVLVFWGVDQDHNPQDFSVTISYRYSSQESRLRGVAARPASQEVDLDAGVAAAPVQVKITNGNFTIKKATMVPGHSWQHWGPGITAIVSMQGTTDKTILAGTIKYQIYETGSRSFIAQGGSPYYTCTNKGCDPRAPIALKFANGMSGDFTISLTIVLPVKTSSSDQFTLVVWGEDQDHQPYDFDVTYLYSYASGKNLAVPVQQADSGALVIHHADNGLGPGGDAHCYEMTITDPASNQYWEAHGYQYGTALWPRGPCNRAKYNFFNRKVAIGAGVTMNVYGIHSGLESEVALAPEDGDYTHLYQLTNPGSPLGKQHCLELDNPGGKGSAYWASKGWKYTMPPWKFGQCDRTKFNYVNRIQNNLDGFSGVTFSEFGIQV